MECEVELQNKSSGMQLHQCSHTHSISSILTPGEGEVLYKLTPKGEGGTNCIKIHRKEKKLRFCKRGGRVSQLEIYSHFSGNLFEGHGVPGDPLEAHAIEGEAGEFAHLHLPLNQVPALPFPKRAQYEEPLLPLKGDTVGLEDARDLLHHLLWLHGTGGLHAPGESE